MIDLEAIAKVVEDGLTLTAETLFPETRGIAFDYGENGRVRYEFRIVADTTDYQRPTRDENEVTVYIHGLLSQVGSNIETAQGDFTNALINTSLEIVVPVFNGMDEEGNKKLVTDVRDILDDFFSKNGNGSIEFGGEIFSYGFSYNLAASGVRSVRAPIGDSFNFRVTSAWYFLKYGVPSKSITLSFIRNGYAITVPYKTLGMMRNAVQETDVPSNSENATGKNITASTVLTLTVGMDTITGDIYNILNDFLIDGRTVTHTVRITRPTGNGGFVSADYSMIFNEATLNAQIPLYATNTFKMVEVL